MMEKILESSFSSFDLSGMLVSLANDLICRVALGRKYSGGEGASKIRSLLEELTELAGRFSVGDHIPWLGWVEHVNGIIARVDHLAKEFDEFIDGVIQEHVDGKEKERKDSIDVANDRKDFVDVLLQIQRDPDSGFSIHRNSIKALIMVSI